MDDQSLSAKFEDDQKREALVVSGWWMVDFIRKGNFENGVMCLCDAGQPNTALSHLLSGTVGNDWLRAMLIGGNGGRGGP